MIAAHSIRKNHGDRSCGPRFLMPPPAAFPRSRYLYRMRAPSRQHVPLR